MTEWLTVSLSYIYMKYRCIKKKNIDIIKKKFPHTALSLFNFVVLVF